MKMLKIIGTNEEEYIINLNTVVCLFCKQTDPNKDIYDVRIELVSGTVIYEHFKHEEWKRLCEFLNKNGDNIVLKTYN